MGSKRCGGFFDEIDNGDVDEDDAEEKSLGNGIDMGNGRLINEFDDEDGADGGGGGPCKEAAQATTELID